MTRLETDVAIVGGGAAGLAAAREARRRGASAAIVTDGPLGGDCTFTGCVPSKTVIEAARAGTSFEEALARARKVRDEIASTENAEVLRREGVEVFEGEGVLRAGSGRGQRPTVEVDGLLVAAKGVVLALGSRPSLPPVDGLANVAPLTSETVWDLEDMPAAMAVVGGGAIGCELGQALAGLGVRVTLVEVADRVLGMEDPAASAIVERALTEAGVDVRPGVGVAAAQRVAGSAGGVELRLTDGSSVAADEVLVAAGRRPNTDRGAVTEAAVLLDRRGFVTVDDHLATSLDGVYAAGDVTGLSNFTHAADAMGRLATANIVSRYRWRSFEPTKIPAVTFTAPEVASIGLGEREASERFGHDARVAELPLKEHDRAVVAGRTDGYIKLIAAPNPVIGSAGGGRLVGASIVAERAGEMIAELALAIQFRAFVGQLAMTTHPYPTWSYGIQKAAGQFFAAIEGRSARPARAVG